MIVFKAATIQGGKAPIYTSCRLEPCHVGSKLKISGATALHVAIAYLLPGTFGSGWS